MNVEQVSGAEYNAHMTEAFDHILAEVASNMIRSSASTFM